MLLLHFFYIIGSVLYYVMRALICYLFLMSTYLRFLRRQIESYSRLKEITRSIQLVALARLTSLNYKLKNRQISLWVVKRLFQLPKYVKSGVDPYRYTLILVTTDRSCCGLLNSNVFRASKELIGYLISHQKKVKIITIGTKGKYFLKRAYPTLVKLCITEVGSEPLSLLIVSKITQHILRLTCLSEVYAVIYNRYINLVEQRVSCYTIYAPYIIAKQISICVTAKTKFYSFWRSVHALYEAKFFNYYDLFFFFFCLVVLDALEENEYSELGARYRSMDNSHTNISEMLNSLIIRYHKTRQESITRELIEIISAASCIIEG